MGEIIKGKPVADAITETLKADVESLKAKGIEPKLKIVRVGAREDDLSYERGALKRMEKCGIAAEVLELPADICQADFVKALKAVNDDASVHGILLFRPLPKQLDMEEIKFIVDPVKDIDCMNPLNAEKIFEGDKTGYPPCTPQACVEILDYYGVDLKGKNVAVVGRSMVVGKPLAMLLLGKNATVTICHSRTSDLPAVCRQNDVVVAAVGRAEMVKGNFIKDGAVVIDVGINVNSEGKLCGDVAFNECVEKASMITPVPAGVGSVTTSVLAKHVVKACKQINGIA
ncbi:MAG: bifunctional 5,10-methylenetetrahydrofolate dehydrogenase/5,10-methenyltetrahydrofolate cyclohydrolase [Clostridia bacterium]|jgi:methylenetetrahydrofolate dehydrogenase (NADP+)/methenyltetrahydrofolate cyclohydrolase|nr:bifunctional 5,10-methylenetetrahydrofolate dehydrogenase/5,10-methenyltetrahydrofolate cyclohydrolase [Clostridia bacterium]